MFCIVLGYASGFQFSQSIETKAKTGQRHKTVKHLQDLNSQVLQVFLSETTI